MPLNIEINMFIKGLNRGLLGIEKLLNRALVMIIRIYIKLSLMLLLKCLNVIHSAKAETIMYIFPFLYSLYISISVIYSYSIDLVIF